MRNLIERILKEETNPDDVRKGIDLAVKMLKKTYPFIVGWDYSDWPDTYTYKIYINLEVDYEMSMNFYNLKPHPRYGKFIKDSIENREKLPYPYSLMNYEEENFDIESYYDIQTELSDIYNDIPIKFKMKKSEAVFEQDNPKELSIDNYIFVK